MKLLLASPRGFCAGVERAIDVVLIALERLGPPVYVRRQIVHNRHVIEALSRLGAIFVDEVEDAPEGATLVLSAHGVAPAVYLSARERGLKVIDATCPLVTKVHAEALRFAREGRPVIIVGHRGHDEVIGTLGYTGAGARVVESVEEAERLEITFPPAPAVITQTTLAVGDTRAIVDVLRRRFPGLITPARDDICYATQNRQNAVFEIAKQAEVMIVLGSATSSNSNRLREVADAAGVRAYLIEDASQLRPEWLDGVCRVGVTSGASTPERLVAEVVDLIRARGGDVETIEVTRESITFAPPPVLARLETAGNERAVPPDKKGVSTAHCGELRGAIDAGR